MDFNQLLQEINSCHSMRIADGGELVTMDNLKGKHIFAASRYVGAHPGSDMMQVMISIIVRIDGKAYTPAELDELPGYMALLLMEMLSTQLPGTQGEMCNR